MTTIIPIAKYDFNKKTFLTTIDEKDKNKALSVVRKIVINDESNPKFDVILFANGNRAKDITKDGVSPYTERDYTEKISRYFKHDNKNLIIEHILLDNDSPLDTESQLFAQYIDNLSSIENIDTISVIGHSKCGTVFFNTPKYLNNDDSYKKLSITTTATPFNGCLLASPMLFLGKVKKIIDNKLPIPLNVLVFNALVNYYSSISSGSHMDNDIALKGYSSDKYDPDFIAKMLDVDNIEAVKKIRKYTNFITGIDDESLKKSLARKDFTSVGMCLLDRYFMEEVTDGFVEVKSQEKVDEYFDSSHRVKSATHYFLSHEDELSIVLDSINDDIEEYKDKKNYEGKIRH